MEPINDDWPITWHVPRSGYYVPLASFLGRPEESLVPPAWPLLSWPFPLPLAPLPCSFSPLSHPLLLFCFLIREEVSGFFALGPSHCPFISFPHLFFFFFFFFFFFSPLLVDTWHEFGVRKTRRLIDLNLRQLNSTVLRIPCCLYVLSVLSSLLFSPFFFFFFFFFLPYVSVAVFRLYTFLLRLRDKTLGNVGISARYLSLHGAHHCSCLSGSEVPKSSGETAAVESFPS